MEGGKDLLTSKHKLQLLKDILQNNINEHHLSAQEEEQVKRLLDRLSSDPSLSENARQLIATISELPFPLPEQSCQQ